MQTSFDRALESIVKNESDRFDLEDAVDGFRIDERLTIAKSRVLAQALQRNTSVERFTLDLDCCSIPAISPFVDFVRCRKRLKSVLVDYDPSDTDYGVHRRYKAELINAVQDSPSVERLSLKSMGSPEAVYNLLANTTSLKEFEVRLHDISNEVATSISSGMCRNTSNLTDVRLSTKTGPLELALAGLVATSVESLTLSHAHPTAELWGMLLRVLPCMPHLKRLSITLIPTTTKIWKNLFV